MKHQNPYIIYNTIDLVALKARLCAKISCLLTIVFCLFTGCHDEVVPPYEPTPRAEAERTVIVYMAGDNSLGNSLEYNAIPVDTAEMAKGKSMIPENVNFIVFVDDLRHKPAIYELSRSRGMQLWKQYDEELCTTDSLTMLNVLREIEHYFPARHYGITFWSHASGWVPERTSTRMKTFGRDETNVSPTGKVEMEIPVLHDVLAHLPRFDYIFFDACFMQCIEVAYELRDVTDYMVGSPAEIPGPGAPYDKIIGALCTSDVKGIVRGYGSGYPGVYDGFFYSGVLLSCIDCSKLEELAEATGHFLTPFYMNRTEQSPTARNFQAYCYDVWASDRRHLTQFTCCFDMRTTMYNLLSEDDYAAWMELYDEAVPLYTYTDPPVGYTYPTWYAIFCDNPKLLTPRCYGGVSMFVPLNIYDGYGWNEDFRNTSWYKAAGWDKTGW